MKAKFKFSQTVETLNIINTGGHLVEYLSKSSEICPLIDSEIKLIKELGKGEYGTAFLIKIDGMGEKHYVAKVSTNKCSYLKIYIKEDGKTLRSISEELETKDMIPIKTFIELNGNNPDKIYSKGTHKFIYPGYSKMCLTSKTINYKKNNGTGEIIVPKGSYLCDSESYSEYIIAILCADLYRKGISVNFLDVFGFASCPQQNKCLSKQYTFMEKAGETLHSYLKKNKKDATLLEVSFIQIIHAIGVYQKHYKLQHNDLHMDNILIEEVNSDTLYKNKKIYEADWYHYKIYNTNIYLPKTNILIKIVDFGFSVKYTEPIIGNKKSLTKGLASSDKRRKPWIPNWYAESSDVMFMAEYFYSETPYNMFIENVFGWMLGFDKQSLAEKIYKEIKRGFVSGGDRPDIMLLETEYSHGTPTNILQNTKLMKKYLEIPKKGKIVTLGVII
jgi:serine/threonine protein kinase